LAEITENFAIYVRIGSFGVVAKDQDRKRFAQNPKPMQSMPSFQMLGRPSQPDATKTFHSIWELVRLAELAGLARQIPSVT
jgi:hypothetical protein